MGEGALQAAQIFPRTFERFFLFGTKLLSPGESRAILVELFVDANAILREPIEFEAGTREACTHALQLFGKFTALMIEREDIFFLRLLFGAEVLQMISGVSDGTLQISELGLGGGDFAALAFFQL